MNACNDEDFADMIRQETGFEWEDINDDLSGYPAEMLIDIMTEVGTFAGIVANDLASFHDPSVMPEIHKAFEEGKIDDPFVYEEELEDEFYEDFSWTEDKGLES